MENGIKGSRIGYNLRKRGGCARAVLARLPPSLQSCIRLLQNFVFVISLNFHKFFNFLFREIKIFAAPLLLHNLPFATHPPLPSAKRFFNAAQQCYFDMKTNKEQCFSILSYIILCVIPISFLLAPPKQQLLLQCSKALCMNCILTVKLDKDVLYNRKAVMILHVVRFRAF